jgi:hypothetical protein
MSNEEHHSSRTNGNPSRRFLLLGAVMALAITVVTLLAVDRDDKVVTTSSSASSERTSSVATATTIPNTKAEVTARLKEILQIRHSQREMPVYSKMFIRVTAHASRQGVLPLPLLKERRFSGGTDQPRLKCNQQEK